MQQNLIVRGDVITQPRIIRREVGRHGDTRGLPEDRHRTCAFAA